MRRKPGFDRFHAGLATHCDSIYKKICDPMGDYSSQDFTNELRSKLSMTWKYLIEKINKLEQESKDKDQRITHLESVIRDMGHSISCACSRLESCHCVPSVEYTCANCCLRIDYLKHKQLLDQLNKEKE